MKRSTRSSIWPCATSPRSGRCRSATGSQLSIVLRWNLRSGSRNDQKATSTKRIDRLVRGKGTRFRPEGMPMPPLGACSEQGSCPVNTSHDFTHFYEYPFCCALFHVSLLCRMRRSFHKPQKAIDIRVFIAYASS